MSDRIWANVLIDGSSFCAAFLEDGEGKDIPPAGLVKMETAYNGCPWLARACRGCIYMLKVDFTSIQSPALLRCAVSAWTEKYEKRATAYSVRFGKGWEGKVSLNRGQENICLQVSLASHTACLVAASLVPESFLGWPQPRAGCEICHTLTLAQCCATSIQRCDCPMPSLCPKQTLPSGQCSHSHAESLAELGTNRNMMFLKSSYSNVSEFLSKLYVHCFGLLGKPQPDSILSSGKWKAYSFQLAKLFPSSTPRKVSLKNRKQAAVSQCPSTEGVSVYLHYQDGIPLSYVTWEAGEEGSRGCDWHKANESGREMCLRTWKEEVRDNTLYFLPFCLVKKIAKKRPSTYFPGISLFLRGE